MKVVATYQVPARDSPDPDKRGQEIALGMTIGSWSGISSSQQQRQKRYAGKYLGSEQLDLPIGKIFRLKVAYPIFNFPARLGEILVAVFGKLSMNGEIKLVDLSFPPELARRFSGPKFGIEGIRKKLNLPDRPLLMSIFKCGFGLSPKEYARLFAEQVEGGVDLVKDDEIFFDEEERLERIKYCREVIEAVYQREKRHILYAVNLSGFPCKLLEQAHLLVQAGANAFLVNVFAYGWNSFTELTSDSGPDAVMMAHPALAGALYPAPYHGFSSPLLLGSFMRMAGADLALFPSPYGSVSLPADEAFSIATKLTEPGHYRPSFPVPSAGIHPALVPRLIKDFGVDVVINAGGGIHHHPGGTKKGAQAFTDVITGICEGKNLDEVAKTSENLREALKKWR